MRVGIEEPVLMQAGEHETKDGLAPTRADSVVAGRRRLRPMHSVYVVSDEDSVGRELWVHRRYVNERMLVVDRTELLLVGRLDPVIEFVCYPIAYLLHHHRCVEPGRLGSEQGQSRSNDRGDELGIGQISSHRL